MAKEIMVEPLLSHQLKELRKRFGGKQWWLAQAIGCTEAAVSLWENGKRTPQEQTLARIVHALTEAGASPGEAARLCDSWREARRKCVLGVERAERARPGRGPRHQDERKASTPSPGI
jgi:DNA-binding XRE family transcriptional regulator